MITRQNIVASSVALFAALFLCSGCASMNSAVGRTNYNPASYGTQALIDMLSKQQPPRSDAVAAAVELRNRNLQSIDIASLCEIASREQTHADARVVFIKTLEIKECFECTTHLRDVALSDDSDEVAVAASTTYYRFAESDKEKIAFLTEALTSSPHAIIRMRAAKAMKCFGGQVESVLLEQLNKETSASAALAICETLADFAAPDGIALLATVANDVNRKFESDSFPPRNIKVKSDDVRVFAVRTIEGLN